MNSLSILKSRQVGLLAVAAALLLAVILPVIASAAQLTERSITLSSSSKSAEDVTYAVTFTPDGDAESFVIDFCTESPIIGQACTTPADFTAAGADNGSTIDAADANTLIVTQAMTAGDPVTVELDGITNPSVTGAVYARIVTYDTAITSAGHNPLLATAAGRVDEGGAGFFIVDTIGVSAAVLESMTFCVSGEAIDPDCDPGTISAPTLKLGEGVGDLLALVPGTVSTGSIYTQLSTNAAGGAVVNLKSSTEKCGGLVRFNADPETECDIAPAGTSGSVTSSAAKFGVKATSVAGGSGLLQTTGAYNDSTYVMNWVIGDTQGVTSPYGDPFLNTDGAPANNKNVTLTFGASVTNETPAGLYSADLNLIATGKF